MQSFKKFILEEKDSGTQSPEIIFTSKTNSKRIVAYFMGLDHDGVKETLWNFILEKDSKKDFWILSIADAKGNFYDALLSLEDSVISMTKAISTFLQEVFREHTSKKIDGIVIRTTVKPRHSSQSFFRTFNKKLKMSLKKNKIKKAKFKIVYPIPKKFNTKHTFLMRGDKSIDEVFGSWVDGIDYEYDEDRAEIVYDKSKKFQKRNLLTIAPVNVGAFKEDSKIISTDMDDAIIEKLSNKNPVKKKTTQKPFFELDYTAPGISIESDNITKVNPYYILREIDMDYFDFGFEFGEDKFIEYGERIDSLMDSYVEDVVKKYGNEIASMVKQLMVEIKDGYKESKGSKGYITARKHTKNLFSITYSQQNDALQYSKIRKLIEDVEVRSLDVEQPKATLPEFEQDNFEGFLYPNSNYDDDDDDDTVLPFATKNDLTYERKKLKALSNLPEVEKYLNMEDNPLVDMVYDYTGTDYSYYNNSMRSYYDDTRPDKGFDPRELKRHMDEIPTLSESIWVYRTCNVRGLIYPYEEFEAGGDYIDPGFLSTSFESTINFGGQLSMKIYLPKGTPILPAFTRGTTQNYGEYEIVLIPMSVLRIIKAYVPKNGDIIYTKMVYVGNAIEDLFHRATIRNENLPIEESEMKENDPSQEEKWTSTPSLDALKRLEKMSKGGKLKINKPKMKR